MIRVYTLQIIVNSILMLRKLVTENRALESQVTATDCVSLRNKKPPLSYYAPKICYKHIKTEPNLTGITI
jgi:hypothetical protein